MTPATNHEATVAEARYLKSVERKARHEAKKQKRGAVHERNRAEAKHNKVKSHRPQWC